MNPEHLRNDDDLSRLLQGWRVDAPLPPSFREGVWQRIEAAEAPALNSWHQWWAQIVNQWTALLRQPVGAVAYLVALLVVGAGTGYWSSERFTDRTEAAWRTAYMQAVNPYATAPAR